MGADVLETQGASALATSLFTMFSYTTGREYRCE